MALKSVLRKSLVALTAVGVLSSLSACGLGGDNAASSNQSSDTVNIGVLYPKTGQYAEYGKMFQQGLDLAVEKVNKDGGVQGKKLGLKYFDTQSDPKQSASVAPKIASDSSIVAVVGDYSSGSSMAASPTFQQAGLVHYGFNNSAADFTSTGDHVWTPQYSQDDFQAQTADMVAENAKKISVVYIENDWGKAAYAAFELSLIHISEPTRLSL